MQLQAEMPNNDFGVPTSILNCQLGQYKDEGWCEVNAFFGDRLSAAEADDVSVAYAKACEKILKAMQDKAEEHPSYLLSSSDKIHLHMDMINKYFKDFLVSHLRQVLFFGETIRPPEMQKISWPDIPVVSDMFIVRFLLRWNQQVGDRAFGVNIHRQVLVTIPEDIDGSETGNYVWVSEDSKLGIMVYPWYRSEMLSF